MPAPFDVELEKETEATLEQARKELRETEENKENGIKELRELLHNATNLHYPDDDEFLTIFLRACHYYPESALKMLKNIAEFKKNNSNLLNSILPSDEKTAILDYNIVNVFTNRDQKGRRILLVNCGNEWDPATVSSDQLFRLFYWVHLLAQLEPETQVKGVVCIMDFKGLSMKQIRGLSPQFSMRLLSFIQDAMPLRVKEFHIINQPFIFKLVWAMFKPFIREKLKKRLYFHGSSMDKLHEFLSPEILPRNYGGKLPEINYSSKDWYPCLIAYEDYIRKWCSYGYANTN